MPEVFVSHANQDSAFVEKLTTDLQSRGFSVFRDKESLVAGQNDAADIISRMEQADSVLLVLSSGTSSSPWVDSQQQAALRNAKNVIPVLLSDDGRKNRVWPLVSDRDPFIVDSNHGTAELTEMVYDSVNFAEGQSGGDSLGSAEIVLDNDFDSFSESDQRRLVDALRQLTRVTGDVRVRIRRG